MDLDDPKLFDVFLEIHGTLPQAGPGSREDTLRGLEITDRATQEIEIRRRYRDSYTHGLFVARPAAGTPTERVGRD